MPSCVGPRAELMHLDEPGLARRARLGLRGGIHRRLRVRRARGPAQEWRSVPIDGRKRSPRRAAGARRTAGARVTQQSELRPIAHPSGESCAVDRQEKAGVDGEGQSKSEGQRQVKRSGKGEDRISEKGTDETPNEPGSESASQIRGEATPSGEDDADVSEDGGRIGEVRHRRNFHRAFRADRFAAHALSVDKTPTRPRAGGVPPP